MRRALLSMLTGIVLLALVTPSPADVPSYTCKRAVGAFVIDGVLDDPTWQRAADSSDFVYWDGGTAPASLRSYVQLAWDEDYLYVAWTEHDPDVYANYTGRDSYLWEQDNAEIFVTVPGAPKEYVEFEISPIGTLWDGFFTEVFQGPGAGWDSTGAMWAAHIDGTNADPSDTDVGFTAEMAIPWADIYRGPGLPAEGEEIRMNFNRIDFTTPAPPTGKGDNDQYFGWSATPGPYVLFHRPEYFAPVSFTNDTVTPGGDANLDGIVDVGDLGILAGHWGIDDGSAEWTDGDFNGDGHTDVGDLGVLAGNWGASSVPEPAAITLLAAGLVPALRRRRR